MVSANVKATYLVNVINKKWLLYPINVHKRYTFSKLEIQCKRTCIFHLILVAIPSSLILPVKSVKRDESCLSIVPKVALISKNMHGEMNKEAANS